MEAASASIMTRAAVSTALDEQARRIDALEHTAWRQLSLSESTLLVDVDAAINASHASHAAPRAGAGALLRAPLDQFSDGLRAAFKAFRDEEGDALERSLTALATELGGLQAREARRHRELFAHAKRQYERQLDHARRAAESRALVAREAMRVECEARVAAAELRREEAEALASQAQATHPTIDAAALVSERATLRVRLEHANERLAELASEGGEARARHSEERVAYERKSWELKRQLADTQKAHARCHDSLTMSKERVARLDDQLTIAQHTLGDAEREVTSLRSTVRRDRGSLGSLGEARIGTAGTFRAGHGAAAHDPRRGSGARLAEAGARAPRGRGRRQGALRRAGRAPALAAQPADTLDRRARGRR